MKTIYLFNGPSSLFVCLFVCLLGNFFQSQNKTSKLSPGVASILAAVNALDINFIIITDCRIFKDTEDENYVLSDIEDMQKRVSMIPQRLRLLVKNDLIDVNDLYRLTCAG